jgi:hypothetical protein
MKPAIGILTSDAREIHAYPPHQGGTPTERKENHHPVNGGRISANILMDMKIPVSLS